MNVSVGVGVGAQSRSRIEILPNPLVMARSCLPSPFKSPIRTELAPDPTPKFVVMKLPVPSPTKIDTLFELPLPTARSCLPSLLKSPTATEIGLFPTPW